MFKRQQPSQGGLEARNDHGQETRLEEHVEGVVAMREDWVFYLICSGSR